ncbi:unnamed protein product [Alopecurus aequalis]
MAAPAQSPLRRWKRFLGAFESVDAAIEAFDPDLSRDEFRRARVKIVEMLCDDATDDDHAERLFLALDDVMAESLETLKVVPAMPGVLATTDLAKSISALRKHDSERVRALASGIKRRRRASLQDDLANVIEAMNKLDNVKNVMDQQVPPADATTKKIPYSDRVLKTAKIVAEPKIMVSPAVRGDRAELCSKKKLQAAKRKFQEGYREADGAKRLRGIQVVEAPEMLKQRQRSRASCTSPIVKETFSVTKQHLHRV